MSAVRIRALKREDVAVCAALHHSVFSGFFLSELGLPFLRELYASFVEDPDAIALVGVDNEDAIAGVVIGSVAPRGFFKRLLLGRWLAFAWAALPLVLRKPQTVRRVVRAVRYRGDAPSSATGALLSSICVAPQAPAGLGKLLLEHFEGVVRARGGTSAYLTTDAENNERVNDFYRRSGWQLSARLVTPEGRQMNCYTWHDQSEQND